MTAKYLRTCIQCVLVLVHSLSCGFGLWFLLGVYFSIETGSRLFVPVRITL